MAETAAEAGEVPVGAIAVKDGEIIARAGNQVELLKDATAHAEILAITQAEAALGDWRLDKVDIYVTKEPCAMCAGAMVNAHVRRLVYGMADPRSMRRLLAETCLPLPSKVEPMEAIPIGSRRLRPLEFQSQRFHGQGRRGGDSGTACKLTFAEPISGPLALGYGAHFGFGLFVPA